MPSKKSRCVEPLVHCHNGNHALLIGYQILVFTALTFVNNPLLFSVWACYVLLCYGGGFGSMPSFVLDVFGAKNMPVDYGTILTA